MPALLLGAPLGVLAWAVYRTVPGGLHAATAALPLWARALAGLVVGELGYYWYHRSATRLTSRLLTVKQVLGQIRKPRRQMEISPEMPRELPNEQATRWASIDSLAQDFLRMGGEQTFQWHEDDDQDCQPHVETDDIDKE
jgi:hypothetical protein